MKNIIITSVVLGLLSICYPISAQVQNQSNLRNRLPRKAIINAAQRTLQDTISEPAKLLVCDPQTSSITIESYNSDDKKGFPYKITLDTLGITLEIFSKDLCIHSDFFKYKGTNFTKIQAKANASKLKRVKLHKDSLALSESITINFNTSTKSYFMLSCSEGMVNYSGDFVGFVKYVKSLIPEFNTIINSEYANPFDFKDGSVFINGGKSIWKSISKVKDILAIETDSIFQVVDMQESKIAIQAEIDYIDAQQLRLIKVNHQYNKKKKIDCFGFTYEDVVKSSIVPALIKTTNNGIATIEFNLEPTDVGIYCIYYAKRDLAVAFEIMKPK